MHAPIVLIIFLSLFGGASSNAFADVTEHSTIVSLTSDHFSKSSTSPPFSVTIIRTSVNADSPPLLPPSPQAPPSSQRLPAGRLSPQSFLLTARGPLLTFTGFLPHVDSLYSSLLSHTKSSIHSALPLSEVLKILKGEAYTRSLSVHALVLSPIPSTTYRTVSSLDAEPITRTAPPSFAVHDVAYNACERDWSRGGACCIGARGPAVRDELVKLLFPKASEPVSSEPVSSSPSRPSSAVKVCLQALSKVFEEDEGRIVDVLVLDHEGCYRMDREEINKLEAEAEAEALKIDRT